MHDHKAVESSRLRDGPGLVASTAIVSVEGYDHDGVDGGDGDGDLPVQRSIVKFRVDAEWGGEGALVFWWRERERIRCWREVEQP